MPGPLPDGRFLVAGAIGYRFFRYSPRRLSTSSIRTQKLLCGLRELTTSCGPDGAPKREKSAMTFAREGDGPRSATLPGFVSSKLSPRSFAFPHNIICPLVSAKAKIDRMPHFAGAGPFGEFHLRHQVRFDPGRNSFILYLRGKG